MWWYIGNGDRQSLLLWSTNRKWYYGLSNRANSDDLESPSRSFPTASLSNVILVQLCSIWQYFHCRSASRGPYGIAELVKNETWLITATRGQFVIPRITLDVFYLYRPRLQNLATLASAVPDMIAGSKLKRVMWPWPRPVGLYSLYSVHAEFDEYSFRLPAISMGSPKIAGNSAIPQKDRRKCWQLSSIAASYCTARHLCDSRDLLSFIMEQMFGGLVFPEHLGKLIESVPRCNYWPVDATITFT